jgi:hypothetical protein
VEGRGGEATGPVVSFAQSEVGQGSILYLDLKGVGARLKEEIFGVVSCPSAISILLQMLCVHIYPYY